jgi:hypothetical protein
LLLFSPCLIFAALKKLGRIFWLGMAGLHLKAAVPRSLISTKSNPEPASGDSILYFLLNNPFLFGFEFDGHR